MQSIRRQIKRGNAILALNSVTHQIEVTQKKHTSSSQWNHAMKNRMLASEDDYINGITAPLTHAYIQKSKKRNIYKLSKK